MKLLRRKSTTSASAPATAERPCRGCGGSLAADQVACLSCGVVDEPSAGRERRWMLPTGGVVGVALFLVTSASFAATTALRTGDPSAIKQDPPQVAQAAPAAPPASGDGSAPSSADEGKGPDLGAGGGDAAPPAPGGDGGGDPPDDDGGDGDDANSDSGSSGDGGSSGGSGSSDGSGGSDTDKPAPAKVSEWEAGKEGYTVVVYTFNSKSEAKAKAREVAADGHPAGILNSDNFKSLEPGSWLVYIGEYDSAQEAERGAAKHDGDYPGEVTYVGDKESPESEPRTDASGQSTTP